MHLKIVSIIASILIVLGVIIGIAYSSYGSNNGTNTSHPSFSNLADFTPAAANSNDDNDDNQQQYDNNVKTLTYGCEIYGFLNCRPVESEFDSLLAISKASKVHTSISQNIEYVQGFRDEDQAIRMHAYNEDFIAVTNTTGLESATFSVSFWAKKDPNAFNYGHIVSFTNRHGTEGWFFDTGKPEIQSARFILTNTAGNLFTSSDLSLAGDDWVHIVGTFDGQNIRVYLNGEPVDEVKFEGTYKAPAASIPLKIGNGAYCYSCAPWGGELDELLIVNRALTDQEVKNLFDERNNMVLAAATEKTSFSSSSSSSLATELGNSILGHWSFEGNIDDSSAKKRVTNYITPVASMAFSPDGRLFLTEKNTGRIRIIGNDDKLLEQPFATVPDLKYSIMYGLLGIAIDPDFERNHYIYAYYSSFEKDNPEQAINRVVRYTDQANQGVDMKIIIDKIPAYNAFHTGGALAFGPDGKLYISVGEGSEANFALDPQILLGKILRINTDGSIPQDNPDPKSPVFSIGHRNVFGIAFDPTKKNSRGEPVGIATENGDRLYDEINILYKGKNYGWPLLQPANQDPYLTNNKSIKPARTYLLPISPTQAIYYTGDKFPELKGMFLFGSYNNGRIYALKLDDSGEKIVKELNLLPNDNLLPVMAIAQSPTTGDIYFGGHEIYKISSIGVDRAQVVFPVQINMSSTTATIKRVNIVNNTMILDIDPAGTVLSNMTLKIPKSLIDGFTSVTAITKNEQSSITQETELDFTVIDSTASKKDDYSVVSVSNIDSDREVSIVLEALRVTHTVG